MSIELLSAKQSPLGRVIRKERAIRWFERGLRMWTLGALLVLGMHMGNKLTVLAGAPAATLRTAEDATLRLRSGAPGEDAGLLPGESAEALVQLARPLDLERGARLLHAAQYGDDLYRLRTRLAVLADDAGP